MKIQNIHSNKIFIFFKIQSIHSKRLFIFLKYRIFIQTKYSFFYKELYRPGLQEEDYKGAKFDFCQEQITVQCLREGSLHVSS